MSCTFRCSKVITADSGNTVGDITGHNGIVNSVAYRPVRPFRIVTAGEDMKIQFYEGPPFKYKKAYSVSSSIHFYAPRKISGEHIVAALSVRPYDPFVSGP